MKPEGGDGFAIYFRKIQVTRERSGMDDNPQGRPKTHWRRSMLAEKAKVETSWEKVKVRRE